MSISRQVDEQRGLREEVDSGYFGIKQADIVCLFDSYQRLEAFDTDVVEADKIGGSEAIISKLRSSYDKGLSTNDASDVRQRIQAFGENKIPQDEMPHCCMYVWEGLEDLMIRILILAAIFQIVVGSIKELQESPNDWVEGMSIIVAVIVVVSVGSITNFSKEKKFRELNDRNNSLVEFTVRRNGQVLTIKEDDILVGEIIKIEVGMVLPADGFLVEGNDIKIEEASLTGESDLIEKESLEFCKRRAKEEIANNNGDKPKEKHLIPSPLVFSGTLVSEGSGWFIALRIGPNSEKGKIQMQVLAEQQKGKSKGGVSATENQEKPDEVSEKEGYKEPKKEEAEEEEEDDGNEGKTPLEIKLEDLANDVGLFGIISASATFVILFIKLLVKYFEDRRYISNTSLSYTSNWYNNTALGEKPIELEYPSPKDTGVEFLRMVILCVAIIVVAIPEGLPLAVTLSLAFSIGKMMEDNNLVRKMNACETMGGATYICSDKTGTLTKNEMSVESFFNCKEEKIFKSLTSNKENREDPLTHFTKDYYLYFKNCLCLNTDVDLDENEKIVKGSKTDFAFIHLLHNFGEKIFEFRKEQFGTEEIKRFPFTSTRKKMSTIHHCSSYKNEQIIFMKGASEIVLGSCNQFLNPETAEAEPISDEKIQIFKGVIKNFADRALRTICIAYKDITKEQVETWKEKDSSNNNLIEKDNFVLLGIFGIKDQLRDGVANAVDICQKAGITVVMVTGDNIDTANAIARECHILTDDIERDAKENKKQVSFVGLEFYERIGKMWCDCCGQELKNCLCPRTDAQAQQMLEKRQETDPSFKGPIKLRKERIGDMEEFKRIFKNIRVIARSRPEDKYTMVYGLRELDEVVAVTGDGTNDAPALSKSDVGFAMGISGTDIAKQAADIIILDDNFATIVQAVKWGRNIYDNIRKFIQFQLTVNICSCALICICCAIGTETPINPIQMLWLNLIMDSLGSLALSTESPNLNLLDRKPYPKSDYIINSLMWKHIFYQAMWELALMLFLYTYGHRFIPESSQDNIDLANTLIKCFGWMPGQIEGEIPNPKLIIAGPSQFWDKTKERLPDVIPRDCTTEYGYVRTTISFYEYDNLAEAQKSFLHSIGSVQLTIIFHTFVVFTLFNQINARMIDDSYNVFADIHKNFLFIIIIFVELGLQAIIVQFTGIVFQVYVKGLDSVQWGICLGLGATTFICSVILKIIPFQKCFDALAKCYYSMKGEEKVQEEPEKLVELQANPPEVISGEEVQISNKNKDLAQQSQLSHQSQTEEKKRSNQVLLQLRRPSRQTTVRQESKMRSIKE